MILDYKRLRTERDYRNKFYLSTQWRKLREIVFAREPLCRMCKEKGKIKLAQMVDHIVDITLSPHLCLEISNCAPLCWECHTKKTAATTNNPKSTGIVNSAIDFDLL